MSTCLSVKKTNKLNIHIANAIPRFSLDRFGWRYKCTFYISKYFEGSRTMAMTTMIHLVDCAYKCSFSFVDISWILCPDLFGMLFAFSSQLQFRCTLSLQMFSWFQARVVFLMHVFSQGLKHTERNFKQLVSLSVTVS